MRFSNVAFFFPQIGCKHRCAFCNQSAISGEEGLPSLEGIEKSCEEASLNLKTNIKNSEIAFFGGSFTALPKAIREKYLKFAGIMVKKYGFKGIRCSTRPDNINEDILKEFIYYGGSSIELGCQSMDDEVLSLNKRGHTKKDIITSSELIKGAGLELGHQIMIGLYGDNDEKFSTVIESGKKSIALKPDTVRIYPTLIMKNTELEELFLNKKYNPLTLDQAVNLSSKLIIMYEKSGVKVIRVGLHDEVSMVNNMVAGPYHPAFRELCESKIFLDNILEKLKSNKKKEPYVIVCNKKDGSKIRGQKRKNLKILSDLGYNISILESESIEVGNFFITSRS